MVGDKIRIFVCDDSLEMRRLLELQLGEDQRFDMVGNAGMPEACLTGVADTAPDLVLIDHGVLPRSDWERFVQDLRRIAPAARLILYSGLPESVLAREAREHQLDGFLEKGQSATELCAGVAALADDSSASPGR